MLTFIAICAVLAAVFLALVGVAVLSHFDLSDDYDPHP